MFDGGDPDGEQTKKALAKQKCSDVERLRRRAAAAAKGIAGLDAKFRGGSIDLEALRSRLPLPETADELCDVAKALGALGRPP